MSSAKLSFNNMNKKRFSDKQKQFITEKTYTEGKMLKDILQ